MSKPVKKILWVLFAGFLVGTILFFPMSFVKGQIEGLLVGSPLRIRLGALQIGTALHYGVGRGGVLALSSKNTSLTLPNGAQIDCADFVVSPHVFSLFLTKAKVLIACESYDNAELSIVFQSGALFSFAKSDVDVELSGWPASTFAGNLPNNLSAFIKNAKVQVRGLDLASGQPQEANVDLELQNIQTPTLDVMIMVIPELSFKSAVVQGNLSGKNLKLSKFNLGDSASPIELSLGGELGLGPNKLPISGQVNGKLRIQESFEKAQFTGKINLDQLFGPIKSGGSREFSKKVTANPLWILDPPVDKL